nr:MAG TPA: hypothetical protein [Caudoviricetes sp.]
MGIDSRNRSQTAPRSFLISSFVFPWGGIF